MKTIFSERHRLYRPDQVKLTECPLDSWEVPARAETILQAVQAAQFGPIIEPTDHGLEPILDVHTADYIEFLQNAYHDSAACFGKPGPVFTWTFAGRHAMRKPKSFLGLKGYYSFGWGTPILEGTWEAAYWSAQCALTAADRVQDGESAAYALCRPPGHHAGPELYGGYCYLNNAAIASRYLSRGGNRVAILDVDYHHGNGTQLVFYTDPQVFYGSLHGHPDEEYPFYWGGADETGAGQALGTNRNWPLPRGAGDAVYLAALDEALAAIGDFSPRYLVVSAGLDTVEGDPEGGFMLSKEGLGEVGRRISSLGLPTVIVQEGGYLLSKLGEHAQAFLQSFAERSVEMGGLDDQDTL